MPVNNGQSTILSFSVAANNNWNWFIHGKVRSPKLFLYYVFIGANVQRDNIRARICVCVYVCVCAVHP